MNSFRDINKADMRIEKYSSYLFYLLLSASTVVTGCPDQCHCEENSTGLYVSCNCKGQNFTGTEDLPNNTSMLTLDSCFLPPEFSLNNQHLMRIELNFRHLTSIPNGSFSDLPNLSEIKVEADMLPLSELVNIFSSLRSQQPVTFNFCHVNGYSARGDNTLKGSYLEGLEKVQTNLFSLQRSRV